MNGSEVETAGRRQPQEVSQFSYTQSTELTDIEKMDLTVFSASPTAKTIFKLMELQIIKARNDAMSTDPSDQAKQLSLMTIAHAMDKFYKSLRGDIEFAMAEHVADVKQKVLQEELKDREKLETIILHNQTH